MDCWNFVNNTMMQSVQSGIPTRSVNAIKLSLKCRSRALAAIGIKAVFPSYSVAVRARLPQIPIQPTPLLNGSDAERGNDVLIFWN
jgi:hypothetical protein